jgi:hypothetical protein
MTTELDRRNGWAGRNRWQQPAAAGPGATRSPAPGLLQACE